MVSNLKCGFNFERDNQRRKNRVRKNEPTCPNTMTSNLIPKALNSVRSSTPFTPVLYFAYLSWQSELPDYLVFQTGSKPIEVDLWPLRSPEVEPGVQCPVALLLIQTPEGVLGKAALHEGVQVAVPLDLDAYDAPLWSTRERANTLEESVIKAQAQSWEILCESNGRAHLHCHLRELFSGFSDDVSQSEDGTEGVVPTVTALQVGVGHTRQDVPSVMKQKKQIKRTWIFPNLWVVLKKKWLFSGQNFFHPLTEKASKSSFKTT